MMPQVLDGFEEDEPVYGPFDDDRHEDDLIACPQCGGEIYAESQQCPQCGHWILDSDPVTMLWRPKRGPVFRLVCYLLVGLVILSMLVMAATALWP